MLMRALLCGSLRSDIVQYHMHISKFQVKGPAQLFRVQMSPSIYVELWTEVVVRLKGRCGCSWQATNISYPGMIAMSWVVMSVFNIIHRYTVSWASSGCAYRNAAS